MYTSTQWYTTSLLLWYGLNILWFNIGNDIGFPNKHVNVNRLEHIGFETKSEDQ